MLDVNLIRQNPEKVKEGIKAKNSNAKLVDDFLALDDQWRKLVKEIDDLRAEQKKLSDERKIQEATKIKDKIQSLEADFKKIEKNREEILYELPNLPLDDVPLGKSEKDNAVLREVGKKPEFNFEPKDHLELGKSLNLIDFETAAKVSGSNFYYLKNQAALLELALINYAFDILMKEGFAPIITPDLARQKFYTGTGYLPQGPEAQTYEIKDSDLGLVATAEITLAGIHSDEI